MSQIIVSPTATQSVPEMVERCDRCGAAAKLSVLLAVGGELSFCGHHATKYAHHILGGAQRITVEAGYTWRGPLQGLTPTVPK